jgi:hypothetical protein
VRKSDRRSWLLYPMLAGIAGGVLASCAQPAKPPPPVQAVEEAPPPHLWVRRRRHVPRPLRKPELPPEAAAAAAGETALAMSELGPAAGAGGVPQPLQPSELVGLDEAGAIRLLGAATAEAAEPPAKVWRYAVASCELDLYFYFDLKSARMRALRYTFKDGATDPAEQQQCLGAIAAARRG